MSEPAAQPKSRRRRLPTPQEQIDTRAIEIAAKTDARQDGHEDLCAERYKNLYGSIADMKKDQADRHTENKSRLTAIETSLTAISTRDAATDGQRQGAKVLGLAIKDWLVVIIALAALVSNFMHH